MTKPQKAKSRRTIGPDINLHKISDRLPRMLKPKREGLAKAAPFSPSDHDFTCPLCGGGRDC